MLQFFELVRDVLSPAAQMHSSEDCAFHCLVMPFELKVPAFQFSSFVEVDLPKQPTRDHILALFRSKKSFSAEQLTQRWFRRRLFCVVAIVPDPMYLKSSERDEIADYQVISFDTIAYNNHHLALKLLERSPMHDEQPVITSCLHQLRDQLAAGGISANKYKSNYV